MTPLSESAIQDALAPVLARYPEAANSGGGVETPHQAARRLSAGAIRKGYKPECLYAYTDKTGKTLHWRIRLKHPNTGDKWIRPMSLNGKGYELVEPKYPDGKPLYLLHELANRADEPAIVCEGEPCADALLAAGVLATTSGAADSASNADWGPLAKRAVTIWPDDDQAGRRYADAVTKALLALGCTVRVIDVAALNLKEGGDAVDWLAGHTEATAEDVLALACTEPTPGAAGAPWSDPQPLLMTVAPERYPLDALPDTIREAVNEVLGFAKAPIPLVASAALGALSLAAQAHIDVRRDDRLQGPVGLFLLTIADSGERKTTCDEFFTKAIRDYEEAQAKEAGQKWKDYKADIGAWESKHAGVKDKIRQCSKNGKPTTGHEEDLCRLEGEKPEPPRVPRLLYADATPEALAYGLAKQWPSGGVVSAEAGIVFGSHGMSKDSIMRNLSLLNQLRDGNSLTIDRRGDGGSFTVRGARLTVALQVQAPTLREFFDQSKGLARGTGFLSRFLIAWPESTQGFRPFTKAPANWPHLAKFETRIAGILAKPVPMNEAGALTPALMLLDEKAEAAWITFHDDIERELASGGAFYDVRDVASKSADNAARLAALFQYFEDDTAAAVGEKCFDGASRIAAWHLKESRRFFGEIAMPEGLANVVRLNDWLIEYCRRKGVEKVPIAKLQQFGPGGLRSKETIEAAMRELQELDRARWVRGIGKARLIEVNSALLGFANAKAANFANLWEAGERGERGERILAKLAGIALANPTTRKTAKDANPEAEGTL